MPGPLPSPVPNAALADSLVGPGFYKLGYVTTDLDRAIEVFTEQLGFGAFARFSPTLPVRTADGRTGPAALTCAFSTGRELVVELLQPVHGLVDIFREPLLDSTGFGIAFHHTGVLVDNLEATVARLPVAPAWQALIPGRMSVSYTRLPGLGHYVEHVEYLGDGGDFLASVRRPAT
ncbi:MAG TPA: VOC family protein [Pseudonocardia sp.]|nr:VOC family protein [Pseudonocardia sp.]